MIERCDKPDVFNNCDAFYYIKGFDNNGVYAYMAIDFRLKKSAILHLEVIRFSHEILKQLIGDWEGIKQILKENEVKTIAATRLGTTEEHKTWLKFIRWFGFNDIKQQVTAIQEI